MHGTETQKSLELLMTCCSS